MQTQTIPGNGGKLYFETIHQISPKINAYITKQIKELGLPSGLESVALELPLKRQKKPIMRANLSYLLYKTFGGNQSQEDLMPALAISELSNYFTYLDNWILDDKNGCNKDIERIKRITLASEVLRDLTQQCVERTTLPDSSKRELSSRLAESTIKCYDGQFRDLELSIDNINEFKSDEDFLRVYEEKSRMQSGTMYGLSADIGSLLSGVEGERKILAREFGELVGTGIHISNDLGDFALFSEKDGSFKVYQDQLSDLVNARLTLPIYYTLKYGSEKEQMALRNMIENKDGSDTEKRSASLAILSSGAYNKMRPTLNKYKNALGQIIKQFPKNDYRDALSSLNQIICYNKYLKDLKSMGKQQ